MVMFVYFFIIATRESNQVYLLCYKGQKKNNPPKVGELSPVKYSGNNKDDLSGFSSTHNILTIILSSCCLL